MISFLPFQIEVSIDCTDYSKLVDQQLDETTMTSAKSHLDTALPELIRELGYTFTANVDQCRANLRQLGGGPDIHAATVARIIGVMVRTHTGLDDPTTLQNMNATGMLLLNTSYLTDSYILGTDSILRVKTSSKTC